MYCLFGTVASFCVCLQFRCVIFTRFMYDKTSYVTFGNPFKYGVICSLFLFILFHFYMLRRMMFVCIVVVIIVNGGVVVFQAHLDSAIVLSL